MAIHKTENDNYSFPQKVWITGSIFALIVVFVLLLKSTFSVIMLILAGVLVAVFFRGFSNVIQRKTKWNETLSLIIAIIGSIGLLVLLFWLIGSKVQTQDLAVKRYFTCYCG